MFDLNTQDLQEKSGASQQALHLGSLLAVCYFYLIGP